MNEEKESKRSGKEEIEIAEQDSFIYFEKEEFFAIIADPVGLQIFLEPRTIPCGHTFEKAILEDHYAHNDANCPLCGKSNESKSSLVNGSILELSKQCLLANPEALTDQYLEKNYLLDNLFPFTASKLTILWNLIIRLEKTPIVWSRLLSAAQLNTFVIDSPENYCALTPLDCLTQTEPGRIILKNYLKIIDFNRLNKIPIIPALFPLLNLAKDPQWREIIMQKIDCFSEPVINFIVDTEPDPTMRTVSDFLFQQHQHSESEIFSFSSLKFFPGFSQSSSSSIPSKAEKKEIAVPDKQDSKSELIKINRVNFEKLISDASGLVFVNPVLLPCSHSIEEEVFDATSDKHKLCSCEDTHLNTQAPKIINYALKDIINLYFKKYPAQKKNQFLTRTKFLQLSENLAQDNLMQLSGLAEKLTILFEHFDKSAWPLNCFYKQWQYIPTTILNELLPSGRTRLFNLTQTQEGRIILRVFYQEVLKGLNFVVASGEDTGKSVLLSLVQDPWWEDPVRKHFEDINKSTLSALIKNGPDQGKSVIHFLATQPSWQGTLKLWKMAGMISEEVLSDVAKLKPEFLNGSSNKAPKRKREEEETTPPESMTENTAEKQCKSVVNFFPGSQRKPDDDSGKKGSLGFNHE